MEIQQLTRTEMDEAARVFRASFDHQLPWLAGIHTAEEDAWYFRERLFAEGSVWGAINNGAIAGIIAFSSNWVHQLYVLPAMQGMGIGSKLLDTAKVANDRLQLWTFRKNALARTFYEAKGFIAISSTDGSDNEEKEPDVLYS